MKFLKRFFVCVSVLFFAFNAHADNLFRAEFAGQQTVGGTNALSITFSAALDPLQNLDSYFSLSTDNGFAVEGSWVLSEDTQVVYFTNIEADTRYVIKIQKGLKAKTDDTLKKEQTFKVKTRAVRPVISFDSKGFILASKLTRGLPVNTLNIDKADIDFFRVKPKFLDAFRRQFGNSEKIHYYLNKDLHTYTDLAYSGRWDLEIKKDLRTRVNIPITPIRELEAPGIYFAVLKGAGHYNYSFSSTWFTISDLGLHVKKYKNSIQFHVQSLDTSKPLKGVKVEGYGRDGKRQINLVTDDDGIAVVKGGFENLTYVMARLKNNISLVPMDLPALDLSEFKAATEPFRPVDLFVYGPRDLYRPGEVLVMDGLLRNQDGKMTAGLPITANVIRPDGRVIHEFQWRGKNLNHYHYEYALPADAMTGKWRIAFTHAVGRLKDYNFTVAEFLPERMKLTIENPGDQKDILGPKDTPVIQLKGDFLYGAPASGSRANAVIHLKPARKLFDEKYPGYEFGDTTDTFTTSYETDSIQLDQDGVGRLTVKNQWETSKSPLWLTANASLYDSGGRPVVRSKSWQIWPAHTLAGIRLLSDDGQVKNDSTAQFEIIVVNRQGQRVKADGLKAVVIKEHREYYWEFRHDAWQWHHTSQFYTVDKFSVDVPEKGPAMINIPVKWGGYRLEITDPATGLVSSHRIWAGWRQTSQMAAGGANRPDRVDLALDKPYYGPGDTARVTVKAPEGGSGYLFVESDTNLLTLPLTVPAEGKTVDIKIDPAWNRHDLYISALILRKGESPTGNLPKRSVGLIHLPLDRTGQKLSLEMNAPEKTEPGQSVEVTVDIKRADGSIPKNAFVTLAAVDIGILNLSGFETPSPYDYFFQDRKYSVEIHDLYQRLIEANDGAWANQRFGGDAPKLSRGGDRPSTDVQIVAISKTAVKADENGMAKFSLKLPEFNGSVRLMAIAHTAVEYGSLEEKLTIASPLVTQITRPRFLSMGDRSQFALDVHNRTNILQELDLTLDTTGPVRLLEKISRHLTLDADKKTTLVIPVFAEQRLGRSLIHLTMSGLSTHGEKRQIKRTWFIETRPAYPATTKIFRQHLSPLETFSIIRTNMGELINETINVQAVLSSFPPINIPDHVAKLNAYPYGCLEQTTSGIFPHVILSAADFAALDISSQSPKEKNKKIGIGIQRLMEKQKSTGGFGLWSDKSPESFWLTAYAVDFLIHAGQAGYEVPANALARAMERLKTYVKRPGTITPRAYLDKKHYRAAARVYAAFVLARVQGISLGDARALYDSVKQDLNGALGFVHAGLSLCLTGDEASGIKALEQALKQSRNPQVYYGDYGSNLRDYAASYFLVSSFYPGFKNGADFLFKLQDELLSREHLSTQERNALVMAGSINLKSSGKTFKANIKTGTRTTALVHDRVKQVTSLNGESSNGFEILNKGEGDLFLSVTLQGYPAQKPKPEAKGVSIRQRFLSFNGTPLSETGKTDFKSGDRLLVELEVTADKRMPNGLVVSLLAAGLELEDPNLSGSTLIDEIQVDQKTVVQWHKEFEIRHTEYRDDRFVAALDIPAQKACRIFYPVRVVSPGDYIVPPPLVEDMYKPVIRGIGDVQPLIRITRP